MTPKEQEILKATKEFAESHQISYNEQIESLILNAIREAVIQPPLENKSVYVVECSSGIWDEYHWWIDGIFENPEDAEKHAQSLNDENKRVLAIECPIQLDEDSNMDDATNEELKLYLDWAEVNSKAKEWNGAEVTQYPLNKPFEKLKSLRQLFTRRKAIRYEVMSLMTQTGYHHKQLKDAQVEGWEICGDILLKNKDGWCGSTYFHIPMRRRVD